MCHDNCRVAEIPVAFSDIPERPIDGFFDIDSVVVCFAFDDTEKRFEDFIARVFVSKTVRGHDRETGPFNEFGFSLSDHSFALASACSLLAKKNHAERVAHLPVFKGFNPRFHQIRGKRARVINFAAKQPCLVDSRVEQL